MAQASKDPSDLSQLLVIAVVGMIGFAFWPAFLLAAFLLYVFLTPGRPADLPKTRAPRPTSRQAPPPVKVSALTKPAAPEKQPDQWAREQGRARALKAVQEVTAQDPCWQSGFEDLCESVAEVRFLRIMIDHFGLKPQHGYLIGPETALCQQFRIDRMTVDFLLALMNVVEVDGAAYHSSPQAKARDAFIAGYGFRVLRIPAKYVLYDEARTVRSYLNLSPQQGRTGAECKRTADRAVGDPAELNRRTVPF